MVNVFARRGTVTLAVATAWVMLAGCGGGDAGNLPTAPVSGIVNYEGKPVAKGAIHFHPEKGQTANGYIEDGKFTLSTYKDGDGATVGKNRVAIEVSEEVKTKDGDTTTKSLIPDKFSSPDKSGIELQIPESGRKNLQINLTKSGTTGIKEE